MILETENPAIQEALTFIANRLGFETLETRKSDSLDFREIAVWSMREALEAAYRLGVIASTDDPVEKIHINKLDIFTESYPGMAGESCETIAYTNNGKRIRYAEWITLASKSQIEELSDLIDEVAASNLAAAKAFTI